jgi:hypothetical protein
VTSEEDFDQYSQVLADAFAIPKELAGHWLRRLDKGGLRVLKYVADIDHAAIC